MMLRAKEGSRTPTRVTPLEPEGTAPSEFLQSYREVPGVWWAKVRPRNAAGNSRSPHDNGACTGIRSAESSGSWSTMPVASGRAPIAPRRLGRTLYFPRLS